MRNFAFVNCYTGTIILNLMTNLRRQLQNERRAVESEERRRVDKPDAARSMALNNSSARGLRSKRRPCRTTSPSRHSVQRCNQWSAKPTFGLQGHNIRHRRDVCFPYGNNSYPTLYLAPGGGGIRACRSGFAITQLYGVWRYIRIGCWTAPPETPISVTRRSCVPRC